jgi:hypothetical protein
MIFFTSNLGYSDVQQSAAPIGYRDEATRKEAQDADVRRQLRRSLSPEFANRLRLVHFARLSLGSAERILRLEMERILARYREVHGIEVASPRPPRPNSSAAASLRARCAALGGGAGDRLQRRGRPPHPPDDRGPARDREGLLRWLRELRAGGRAFDPAELKARVLAEARAVPATPRCGWTTTPAASPTRRREARLGAGSLLHGVQGLLERTYGMRTRLDAARFVIGDLGYRTFYVEIRSGGPERGARTLLRETGEGVRAAIYYPDRMIAALEKHPPHRGLIEANVDAFAALVEELDHLLCIAEAAERARPVSLLELELHADVSKALVLSRFLAGREARPLDPERRTWLRYHLFHKGEWVGETEAERARYREAARLALRFLDAVERLQPETRLRVLRTFHAASGTGKRELIQRLPAA